MRQFANDMKTEIQRQWHKNPTGVFIAGATAVTAVAKLIDAVSAAQGRRAYAKQVNMRVKQQKKSRK